MTAWNKCLGCEATPSAMGLLAVPIVVNSGRESSGCGASWLFWKFNKFCPGCGVAVEKLCNVPGKQRQAAQEGGKQ